MLDWNATLLNAIQAGETAPPLAARNQAIVQAAIYDAVNAIDHRYTVYQVNVPSPLSAGAAPIAAAAQAAYQALVDLYPSQPAEENGISRIYGGVHVPSANRDGIDTGKQIANYIVRHTLTLV